MIQYGIFTSMPVCKCPLGMGPCIHEKDGHEKTLELGSISTSVVGFRFNEALGNLMKSIGPYPENYRSYLFDLTCLDCMGEGGETEEKSGGHKEVLECEFCHGTGIDPDKLNTINSNMVYSARCKVAGNWKSDNSFSFDVTIYD